MFLKHPIICSHVYCYSNKALPPPKSLWKASKAMTKAIDVTHVTTYLKCKNAHMWDGLRISMTSLKDNISIPMSVLTWVLPPLARPFDKSWEVP